MKHLAAIQSEFLRHHLNDCGFTTCINYSPYLEFTPDKHGGEYYTLRLPVGITPPKEGDKLRLDGVNVVVQSVSSPEDIMKGKGEPVARSMRENGIAWSVNCLPEGHKWLDKQPTFFTSQDVRH